VGHLVSPRCTPFSSRASWAILRFAAYSVKVQRAIFLVGAEARLLHRHSRSLVDIYSIALNKRMSIGKMSHLFYDIYYKTNKTEFV